MTIQNPVPGSLVATLRQEYHWWLPAALLSAVAASVLISGWPAGLRPNLQSPYIYDGDFLTSLWMAQRVIEGWLFENPRSGFPFGSSFLDYPGSDAANHLLVKLLGFAGGSAHAALNLYYLVGFPTVVVATYGVSRVIGLSRALSLCAAVLFAFHAFHFMRIVHVFLAFYFVVPIFFYFAFRIYFAPADSRWPRPGAAILTLVVFVILASFGVYYALFGAAVLTVAGLSAWARHRDIRRMAAALGMILALGLGVAANIAPTFIHQIRHGPNPEAAPRHPVASEIYALKLIHLLLPQPDHRSKTLAAITHSYARTFSPTFGNARSSLGAIGSLGFLILAVGLFLKLSGRELDPRLSLLALTTLVLFLIGTTGGLGAIFAFTISPMIRAWERVSIFIAFASITAFLLALQIAVRRFVIPSRQAVALAGAAAAVGFLGFLDQTTPACRACNAQAEALFRLDRDLIGRVERQLPANAAVYQLPYMRFPEVAARHKLETYDLLTPVIHSRTLRWSHAGMKGREADRFFGALAQRPIEEQIEVARQRGFSGIMVHRRGYEDGAKELLDRLAVLLGNPAETRQDGEVVFFTLTAAKS